MTITIDTTDCPFEAALAESAPKWGHENDSDRAGLVLARNRSELALATASLCAPEEDARHHITCLSADLGQTDAAARDYRKIGLMLDRMPKFTEVLTARGFAPLALLKKLSCATFSVAEEHFPALEPLLLASILPTVNRLSMGSWKELFPKVQHAIDTVHHAARPVDLAGAPIPEEVEESFRHTKAEYPEKTHRIGLNLAPAHAEETHRVISTIAATKECTSAEAFMHLIRGTAEASVSLHLYRSIDGGPVWMPGVGTLSEALTEEYMSMVTSVDVAHPSASGGYAATAGQRTFVIGRDGVCMFPGCTKNAMGADMDHITNHAEGGPTQTDNLHALCRGHHNEKTKGLWDVTRSLAGTEYWTSVSSGAQVASEPAGPLSHPGAVPFAASVRKSGALREEHNQRRDEARAKFRDVVAHARAVQPVVRMLQQMRIMSPGETAKDMVESISDDAAIAAAASARARAQDREERELVKLRRFNAQVKSLEPVRDPDPPTVEPPDPIVEMMQIYLNERDPVDALVSVGKLLVKVDPDEIDVLGRSFADPKSLREKIAIYRRRQFRNKARWRKARASC
ncbi:HNH endonuclease signature motif containing protein [Corynebacterium sputi]|uniref:HNH endonuclease signature motif containing protein n=1 Tax=Corynebacterium sputi TaxID=489915 RepID=UPI000423D61E|nr:HNH endonuclease signature motif containing protein [Corynebacterium sputi]